MSDPKVIVGVDVGGTFTDLFLLDSDSGRFRTAKVPSRRGEEAVGFINGLAALGGPGPSPLPDGERVASEASRVRGARSFNSGSESPSPQPSPHPNSGLPEFGINSAQVGQARPAWREGAQERQTYDIGAIGSIVHGTT